MKKIAIIALLMWAVVALAGCSWIKAPSQDESKTVVKVGVILPLTGTSADNGNNIKNGLLLVQKEINSKNQDYVFELIFEDSQYKSDEAVKAVEKLINADKVKYIIGDYGSSQTLAIAPIVEKNGVILITPGTQSNSLSDAGDYVFRIYPSIRNEASYFLPKIADIINNSKVGILALNTDMGKDYTEDFLKIYPELGGEAGLALKFDSKETDFRTSLLKMKAAGIKNLLVIGNRKMAGLIMKQVAEQKMSFKIFMAAVAKGDEYLSVAGSAGEGIILPANVLPQNENYNNFETLYKQSYNKSPELFSINGYDALKILSYCIDQKNSDVLAVKDCLYAVNGKDAGALNESLEFDNNGDLKSAQFQLETVKDGKFVPYQN